MEVEHDDERTKIGPWPYATSGTQSGRKKIAWSDLVFLVRKAGMCSIEHMRYLRRLLTLFHRTRPRPQQLELPFHVKASRRGSLLERRGRAP